MLDRLRGRGMVGFTGRVIGMYASEGTVHFDWFDYEPLER